MASRITCEPRCGSKPATTLASMPCFHCPAPATTPPAGG